MVSSLLFFYYLILGRFATGSLARLGIKINYFCMSQARNKKLVLFFKEIRNKDVPLVGGKNASLGEMFSKLERQGIKVPNGFAITAAAYRYFLAAGGIKKEMKNILKGLDTGNIFNLRIRGKQIRQLILSRPLPRDLEKI